MHDAAISLRAGRQRAISEQRMQQEGSYGILRCQAGLPEQLWEMEMMDDG
jgi:hypothetical protein